ncbi:endonuclease 4-like isoform X2 [Gossypium australe]|uniref:Aspergillus nuclease S1 n=1 Tax=Gossypium australe TaxID=47621 RepID=A0A5B6UEL1_9ROSI|nr:endonuclease 4-like isoform X2 [Gossypium australe]
MGFRRMGWHDLLWIVRLFVLMQSVHVVFSWGKHGHYAVCKIAEGYLTKDAMATVKELLPDYANGELASVCSWPDDIKWYYRWYWTSPLHYVDTPSFKCNYKYGPHYMADVHQPLHVGFTGDLGGSTLKVRWYNKKTNLHHVWDTLIIDTAVKTFYGSDLSTMVRAIQRNITVRRTKHSIFWFLVFLFTSLGLELYAAESVRLACNFAYKNANPGSILEDDYFLSRLPVVEKRLAQGGIRLAAVLNQLFNFEVKIGQSL